MSERRIVEEYLGDGLYASFDGYMIILRAPRAVGDHWVGLEPPVWEALKTWVGTLTSDAKDSK